MRLFDTTTDIICQNGRRGALMLSMSCEHPDILEFINAKTEENAVTKANISVRMTDKFLYASEQDKKFNLHWNNKDYGSVDARSVMYELAYNNWDWAEPKLNWAS